MSDMSRTKRINLPDGTSWPRPELETDDEYGIGHWLRYADPRSLTRDDLLQAASIIDAYGYLVTVPSAAKALPALRRALRSEVQND